MIIDFLTSPYIIAPVVAWIAAQITKYIVATIKHRNVTSLRQLYLSGGMPSAHSATAISLLTVIGFRDGVSSAIFGVGFLFAIVVMYDAMMVRRSSGEQGQALTNLLKEQKSKVHLPRVAKGHTPFEVFVGAIFGVMIGIVVFITTN